MPENTEKEQVKEQVQDVQDVKEAKDVKESKKEEKEKAKKPKTKKTGWFKGLKTEFKKIIWPDRKTLVKQTVAVIVCSLLIGILIAIVDALIQLGLNFIV